MGIHSIMIPSKEPKAMRQLIRKNTLDDTKLSSHSAQPDQMCVYICIWRSQISKVMCIVLWVFFFVFFLFVSHSIFFYQACFFFLILRLRILNTRCKYIAKCFPFHFFFFGLFCSRLQERKGNSVFFLLLNIIFIIHYAMFYFISLAICAAYHRT